VDVEIHTFLTSALAGGELSDSHPCHFTLGEGRSQSRSGRFGEENILESTGTRTPTPQSSSP
jgi:hypothetical protein